MTVGKLLKTKYFIFTLCIFIVFAAWSTVVLQADGDNDGTQFSAFKILSFFVEIPPDSLNQKRPPEFVPWFNYSSVIYENSFNFIAVNTGLGYKMFFNLVFICGQALKSIFNQFEKTAFYLRI